MILVWHIVCWKNHKILIAIINSVVTDRWDILRIQIDNFQLQFIKN